MSRAPALVASLLLHAGVAAAFLAWPDSAEPPKPPPVPIKLVPPPPPDGPVEVSTAPEPSPEPPAPTPEPQPIPEPEPPPPTPSPPAPAPPQPTPPRPRPPTPAPRSTPAPPKPAPGPKPQPAPKTSPVPPKPAPRQAEQPLDLSALGNRLARNAPKAPPKPAGATPGQLAAARAELGQRLQRLWRPNCGPDDSLAVNVRVRFRLRAGQLQGSPDLVGGASNDPVVRAAQERAVAAVRSAAPYDWLPEEMQDGDYQPSFNAEQACG